MISSPTPDSLARTTTEERAIMDGMARDYRRATVSGSLVYALERAAFVRWTLDRLRRIGRHPDDLRFLDVGCGTGEILEELRDAGCRRLVGCDLSPAMLAESARHVPQAGRVRCLLEHPPFARASFDVLMAAFTIHHLHDPRSLFAMADELLAPGGSLFVMDYNRGSPAQRGWFGFALRVLLAPSRFVVRKKNRAEIAAQPHVPNHFNPSHRLLDLKELAETARTSGFTFVVETRGLLAPWFLHDVFPASRFDRALIRGLTRVDRTIAPERVRVFQWMEARRRRG